MTTDPPTSIPSATIGTTPVPTPSPNSIRAICFAIPDGDVTYEIISNAKKTNQPKKIVCTADDNYLVFIEEKKGNDILALYDPLTGDPVQTIKLNYPAYKDIISMVAIPKQPHLVGLIDSEKGVVMNVRDKKVSIFLLVENKKKNFRCVLGSHYFSKVERSDFV